LKENLDEEYPREDVIFGALRRINSGFTFRLALNNPLGMLILIALGSLAVTIFIISIASTLSQITARNQFISTVDQVALRSQYESPYLTYNFVCVDSRFQSNLEESLYAKSSNIWYKTSPQLFNYKFGVDREGMN
jgi:hypothetical protein